MGPPDPDAIQPQRQRTGRGVGVLQAGLDAGPAKGGVGMIDGGPGKRRGPGPALDGPAAATRVSALGQPDFCVKPQAPTGWSP